MAGGKDGSLDTYRVELVLPLHVVLDEDDVMYGLLQLKRVLLARGRICVVQSGEDRLQAVVPESTSKGTRKTPQPETEKVRR